MAGFEPPDELSAVVDPAGFEDAAAAGGEDAVAAWLRLAEVPPEAAAGCEMPPEGVAAPDVAIELERLLVEVPVAEFPMAGSCGRGAPLKLGGGREPDGSPKFPSLGAAAAGAVVAVVVLLLVAAPAARFL
jgi:hypothetical protein